jgi:hypothetical protein
MLQKPFLMLHCNQEVESNILTSEFFQLSSFLSSVGPPPGRREQLPSDFPFEGLNRVLF